MSDPMRHFAPRSLPIHTEAHMPTPALEFLSDLAKLIVGVLMTPAIVVALMGAEQIARGM